MNKIENNNLYDDFRRLYIAPSITIIKNIYNEGLMQSISMNQGTGQAGTAQSKPSGEWGSTWGDIWAEEPTTNES